MFESSNGEECLPCDERNGLCVVSEAAYSCVLTVPMDSLKNQNTAANSSILPTVIATTFIIISLQILGIFLYKNRGRMSDWLRRRFRTPGKAQDEEKGDAVAEEKAEKEKETTPTAPMYPSLECVEYGEAAESTDDVQKNNETEEEDGDEIARELERVSAWLN